MSVRGGGSAQGRRLPSAKSRDRPETSGHRQSIQLEPDIDNFSAADVRFGEPEINPPTYDTLSAVSKQAPKKTKRQMDMMAMNSKAVPRKDGKLVLKRSAVSISSKK